MKKFLLFFAAILVGFSADALDKIKIVSFEETNDILTADNQVTDLNGVICPLVKVLMPPVGSFEGSIMGTPEYRGAEYWIYTGNNCKMLRIKVPGCEPLDISFPQLLKTKKGLVSKRVYALVLDVPTTKQAAAAPAVGATARVQQLTIRVVEPQMVSLEIDGQVLPPLTDGTFSTFYPVGPHSYTVSAVNGQVRKGNFTLTAASPLTLDVNVGPAPGKSKAAPTQKVQPAPAPAPAPVPPIPPVAAPEPKKEKAKHKKEKAKSEPKKEAKKEATPAPEPEPEPEIPAPEVVRVQDAKPVPFEVLGVTFYMVPVEGGSFMMGASGETEKEASADEKPAHRVNLSTFRIGQTEVTQELWEMVLGKAANNSPVKEKTLPVTNMSWNEARQFIDRLYYITGLKFRLPTEAEWEYAARGGARGSSARFSGGKNAKKVAWVSTNSDNAPHPVATKKANGLGIFDLSGNAAEWVSDWYGPYMTSTQNNPTGPADGASKVIRGGSWLEPEESSRVSYRNVGEPESKLPGVGLRLVLDGI